MTKKTITAETTKATKAAPKTTKSAKPIVLEPAETMVNFDAKAAREALGMNQSQFWSKVFVTQSGGSRYENERSVPKPVQALLVISYGTEQEAQAMFNHLRAKNEQVN